MSTPAGVLPDGCRIGESDGFGQDYSRPVELRYWEMHILNMP